MGKHRMINKALREMKNPHALVAADVALQRGDRRALEKALGIDERRTTLWDVHGLDVWGNPEDGFQVNDIYPARGSIRLRAHHTDSDIVDALFEIGALNEIATVDNISINANEDDIDVDDAETGEPVLQLRRRGRHR